ncbi:MAG: hypothetical protein Q9196_007418, partial [Gyalolechia fulgens]
GRAISSTTWTAIVEFDEHAEDLESLCKIVSDQAGPWVEAKATLCTIADRHPEHVEEVKATSNTISCGRLEHVEEVKATSNTIPCGHPADGEDGTENVSSSTIGDGLHGHAAPKVIENTTTKIRYTMNNSRLNSRILNRSRT